MPGPSCCLMSGTPPHGSVLLFARVHSNADPSGALSRALSTPASPAQRVRSFHDLSMATSGPLPLDNNNKNCNRQNVEGK